MTHREARVYLSELGAGSLEQATEEAVASHVTECGTCRAWLGTFELLAGESRAEDELDEPHPEEDLLALCAIRPEEIYEPDREELRSHLERCPTCRRMVALVSSAVCRARPLGSTGQSRSAPREAPSPIWSRRLVAGLVVGLLGSALFLSLLVFDRFATELPALAMARSVAASWSSDESAEQLADLELATTRSFSSDRKLTVSNVILKPGADVTFRGGDVIAFGDGFQVESGARLRVDSRGGNRRAPRPVPEPANASEHRR